MKSGSYRIYALSENTLTIQMAPEISEDQIRLLYYMRGVVISADIPYVKQILVSFNELTIFYDPAYLTFRSLREKILQLLDDVDWHIIDIPKVKANHFTIPVCYAEDMALDKSRLENQSSLTFPEVINLHHQSVYTFYMIGFLPGFLYLGGLNEQLACPRLETPRQKVLSGSVGIAGKQTGIYPMDSPGGWNIIGRTPLTIFDPAYAEPSEAKENNGFLIQHLDKIHFIPISARHFEELKGMTVKEYQQINKSS